MTFLAQIADRVLNRPLLILPDKASLIVEVLAGRIGVAGPEASRFEGTALRPDGKLQPFKVTGDGVAVLSIVGSLVNRGAYIGASSGLVSYEGIQHQIKAVLADDDVESVVLDIQSPGGEAVGAFETAAMVRALSEVKHTVAVVNGMAASAAYAIASGASEIVTIETGVSGSIGVVMLHADYSLRLANDGIKPTMIFAGAHKVDGNPFEPLSDAVKTDLQNEVNAFYEAFLRTVADGRGSRLSVEGARATEARVLIGDAAVKAGLADRVGTFESVLADLSRAPAGRPISPQRSTSMGEKTGAPAAETQAGIPKDEHDAAVAAARSEGQDSARAEAEKAASTGLEAGLKADRERCAKIDALFRPGAESIIAEAKASGKSAADTALAIMEAGIDKKAAHLSALEGDDVDAKGAAPAAAGQGSGAVDQTPEGWKAEWASSDKLKADFISAESYAAYMAGVATGRVALPSGSKAA
jgi:signal peptide peptidase SppA